MAHVSANVGRTYESPAMLVGGAPTWAVAPPEPTTRPPVRTHRGHKIDVLLLDAQYRQTLVCMRSYAGAGLSVGAVACVSDAWWAPSLRSRYCSLGATAPDFEKDPDGYVTALLNLLDAYPARMLLPAHD